MDPDEQWAKSFIYSSKALRVILSPSGRLAVFDHAGRWLGWGADFFFQSELVKARDSEIVRRPSAAITAASTELDF